ncbi:MarR family winged helix-turn-helix transcriptional regulator [Streptomyces clavuligerus]|uniref:Transcriptional regulator, MarR family n=1 Tax=Streptomyces clavuligerus TaxID=1901 RepID=B5GYQ2_STRCL|nr:MarR family transcriptional regulator [Streptomyces clavuligerus]ANW22570.1 MarR family transcriptional regulator [Streptomyces clavuligerus]AXU16954.1 MarR family transcriptional regulator [Streptomyces clavuligerus]AXU17454.1 MarR family transcriptional regulator [Streptomyces clavuligerus]EDY51447.1 transcriptional regulator [Streptomyces clavuligerus]EFG04699.1 Transcriptional regulator, MarR family [Streptomyces clavuligerus]
MAAEQSKIQPLNAGEEALVRSIHRIVHVLPKVMDATMQREQRISLTEYLTLFRLSEAPERKMRMSELAEVSFLSLSGMTHVVTRLQAEDLVERARDAEDRRGWHAVLTDRGMARLHEAGPSNLSGVRRYLLDHLQGFDLHALAQAFDAVGDSPGEPTGGR